MLPRFYPKHLLRVNLVFRQNPVTRHYTMRVHHRVFGSLGGLADSREETFTFPSANNRNDVVSRPQTVLRRYATEVIEGKLFRFYSQMNNGIPRPIFQTIRLYNRVNYLL